MVKSNERSVNNAAGQEGASNSKRHLNDIYYNDGTSLIGEDGSYFVCGICNLEGGLMCCDTCPRVFHFKCLGLESVPEGDWKCSECVKEENPPNEAAKSPTTKDPPAHELNPLFTLAEAGGQIERPLSSDTNSPSKQKQEGEAEEGQQGTVNQSPVVANDAVLLPRDNNEKDAYRKWDSRTKFKYARQCFKRELKISKKSRGKISSRVLPPVTSRDELWFEGELDSLWIGVRRHGQGNWVAILGDPTLKFSRTKTSLDLAVRWKLERQKVFLVCGETDTDTDTDTNTDSDNPFEVKHRVTDISSEGTMSE